MLAPVHPRQADRLAEISFYDLGTKTHEGAFDSIVELVAQTCNCPIALVSIVHEAEQRFEARCGLEPEATGLDASICSHSILQEDILEIYDTRLDMRTRANPLVTDPDDPLLFYAGAPIRTADGLPLGSLCVLDRRPRRLSDDQRRALRILADQIMRLLELHVALRQQDALRREVDHRVKNSLANVAVLTRMAARAVRNPEAREALSGVERRIQVMAELHRELYSDESGMTINLSEYLRRIVGHLEAVAPDGVSLGCQFEPLRIDTRRASALGVTMNELVSNACKHGFPEGAGGEIVVRGWLRDPDTYVITCRDDGVGATGAAVQDGSGLGQKIIGASVLQLGGEIEAGPTERGYLATLTFPAQDP